jgi:hypothetical protein
MATQIQIRRDTAANWTSSNPVLAQGEIGIELVTNLMKIGDGSTAWNSLKYESDSRVLSAASTATLTPNIALYDSFELTAQAEALTIANPTGTIANFNGFIIRVTDNGTARALTFDTKYRAFGSALPTTTVINKTLYIVCLYNSTDDKYDTVTREEI